MTDAPPPADPSPADPSPTHPQLAILRERLIQSELRQAALAAGMVDLDGIRLLDPADIRLDDAHEVVDAPGLMQRLRRDKPYLFAKSTTTNAAAPQAAPLRPRNAMEMSLEEWRRARADLLR